ncbi:hypothetical protein KZZ07_23595 [Mameliella sp. CS4]|uniref:hypothetical protein n=1 Tax=Mameliella sp. CS4 TaxID=2862329 RepID=UPI001C5F0A08|nr:hypothetical protein [Mameliella sp. CS4]MBW4985529.1 hypothetical protein [Mameliella sp. CS4]
MTNLHKTAQQTDTGARKAYAAPKLEIFGEVSALTASGSIIGNENMGSMADEMG